MMLNKSVLAGGVALALVVSATPFLGEPNLASAAVEASGDRWTDAFGDGRPGPVSLTPKADRLALREGAPRMMPGSTVTTEHRLGANTSILVRIPPPELASR